MKRLLLLIAFLPPSISIAQHSGIPYTGEAFSLRGRIVGFLFVALVGLLDWIINGLRLKNVASVVTPRAYLKKVFY